MNHKIECPVCKTVYTTEPTKAKKEHTSDMIFIKIKPGEFLMGEGSEAVKIKLTKSFDIMDAPVTQAQWTKVMGSNPSYFKDKPNNPVETVSWDDCQEFIKKLNQGQKKFKYRLPTEAEWEYSTRAGTKTRYSFGDNVDQLKDHAWVWDNSNNTTHPVRQKEPNPWGLYDVHGNVWEWVQDWYGKLEHGKDPKGPKKGSNRVFRGGSWINYAGFLRSAYRFYDARSYRNYDVGVRLVRTCL